MRLRAGYADGVAARRGRGARVAAFVAVMAVPACTGLLLPDDPSADAITVAHAIWTEVDEYYAFFELKGVDWEAVGGAYLPAVNRTTTGGELFEIMSEMLETLHDGHVALEAPFGRWSWDGWHADHPDNYRRAAVDRYTYPPLGNGANGAVFWGFAEDGIGYIGITSFGFEGVGEAIDRALHSLGDIDGLIVDVRHNSGGSNLQSEAAAGRFVSERAHYRTVRYKIGPGHDDFGPERKSWVEPAGLHYGGPIVVLQNRRTFSAAEDFILAMRTRANVTFMGDYTGGGGGNPIKRELPNGWAVQVSRWQSWGADGTHFEGLGLAPDVAVSAIGVELQMYIDGILDAALELLGGD